MPASIEELRRRKRENMRKARLDPARREAMNASRRGNARYIEGNRTYAKRLRDNHFFRWRARNWGHGVTAKQLAALWKSQRGICPLSGRRLGRDAHLDHKIPQSLGGSGCLENLRWVDPWANHARGNLTDDEFRERCAQVAEWIGRRIVESLPPGEE